MKIVSHTEYRTVQHSHKKGVSCIPCSNRDLFLVQQGLQCGNCGALVLENIPDKTVFTDGTKEPFNRGE